MYALVDKDGDLVDGVYLDEGAAEDALTDHERNGVSEHEGVHVIELGGEAAWALLNGNEGE